KSFQKFYAERFQVSTLVKELDERFRNGAELSDPIHNPITDAVFVKDREHFSLANNCNHMTARMLRELGCQIHGDPGRSAFKVVGKQDLPPQVGIDALAALPPAPPAPQAQPPRATQPPTAPIRASLVSKPTRRAEP